MRKHVLLLCIFAICFFMFGRFLVFANAGELSEVEEYTIYYTSIKVDYDDTLDEICTMYNNIDHLTHEEYKEKLMKLNKMSHEKLNPGGYISIFYHHK